MNKERVIEALKNCLDPELFIDVYTLGLIYKLEINGNNVFILMTLTSPMCPYGPQLINDVKLRVGALEGVKNVNIDLTFDPPWQPSEELKLSLGVQ